MGRHAGARLHARAPAERERAVLSNTYANGKDYLLDISEHRVSLGKDMHALMLKHEHAGTLDAPEYQDAVLELNSRYLSARPLRPRASRGSSRRSRREYMAEIGPRLRALGAARVHGHRAAGVLRHLRPAGRDRGAGAVLCGWYDELTPQRCSRPLADGIADNEFVVFGNSSHLTIFEKEAEPYLAVIRDFLERHA